MASSVALILAALLAAGTLVLPTALGRAVAMAGALIVAPVILVAHVWDTSAFAPLRDTPLLGVGAALGGVVLVGALAVLFDRRLTWFVLAAVAMLPFRVPLSVGGVTANLLLPLYVVIAAGGLAYAVPRLRAAWRGRAAAGGLSAVLAPSGSARPPEHPAGWLERLLALTVVVYAVQATYSSDADRALENLVFFYVPFAILFVLVGRVRWTRQLAVRCVATLSVLALAFVGVGFVEYATKHVLLNPRVISSNALEPYFRVNSLFFDPNIYGRFLAVVMLTLAGVVLWTRDRRAALVSTVVLTVLWAGLVLTFSQSSFVALLAGLAVLGALRWSVRGAAVVTTAFVLIAVGVAVAAPDAVRLDVRDSAATDSATSGRYDLIKGGVELFTDAPVLGQGAGAFAKEYRRAQSSSEQGAASASHTIPVTVAAEQGIGGLALYLALLAAALARLLGGVRGSVPRMVVGAAFVALVVHTFMYAAFLEDPLAWALLGVGVALARGGADPEAGRRGAGIPAAASLL